MSKAYRCCSKLHQGQKELEPGSLSIMPQCFLSGELLAMGLYRPPHIVSSLTLEEASSSVVWSLGGKGGSGAGDRLRAFWGAAEVLFRYLGSGARGVASLIIHQGPTWDSGSVLFPVNPHPRAAHGEEHYLLFQRTWVCFKTKPNQINQTNKQKPLTGHGVTCLEPQPMDLEFRISLCF